jgi:LysR family hydrogen peroxide-inducible transcriptional activator
MARARDPSPDRVYRSLAGERPVRTIAMVTNPYRYRSRLVRQFEEHLRTGPTGAGTDL